MSDVLSYTVTKLAPTTKNFLYSAIILTLAIAAKKVTTKLLEAAVSKVEDDDPKTTNALEQRAKTLGSLINNILSVTFYGIAVVMVLSQWGINIMPILTGAGIMGLAVGFGAQTLVKDMINGFFILADNQFNVGDNVEIGGLKGTVEEMKLRVTLLRGDNNVIHTIPNSNISTVTKYTSIEK
jgi:moderate conductance mechanosensitive channel